MVQQGSYCTLVNQLSNASSPNFDMFTVSYSYIQHNNSNLSTNSVVSTQYKADTTRNNTSDATITVYQNPDVGTFENKGRMRLDATSFEPSCNIFQTGTSFQTVSNTTGASFVKHFNNYDITVYNTVGTYYKADPTNSNTVSDASIVVTPNPLASICIGSGAGYNITASDNICIGTNTGTDTVNGYSRSVCIGYRSKITQSNQLSLGTLYGKYFRFSVNGQYGNIKSITRIFIRNNVKSGDVPPQASSYGTISYSYGTQATFHGTVKN